MEEEKWRRRIGFHTYEYINQSDFRMQTLGEPKRGEKMKEKRTTLFPIDLNKHTAQHTSFYTAIINGALWMDGRFFFPAPPRAVSIRDDNETITSGYVVRSIGVYIDIGIDLYACWESWMCCPGQLDADARLNQSEQFGDRASSRVSVHMCELSSRCGTIIG